MPLFVLIPINSACDKLVRLMSMVGGIAELARCWCCFTTERRDRETLEDSVNVAERLMKDSAHTAGSLSSKQFKYRFEKKDCT